MKDASKSLHNSLIGVVHVFDTAACEFKAVSQFEKFEADFTATLLKEIQICISSKNFGNSEASKSISEILGPIMETQISHQSIEQAEKIDMDLGLHLIL